MSAEGLAASGVMIGAILPILGGTGSVGRIGRLVPRSVLVACTWSAFQCRLLSSPTLVGLPAWDEVERSFAILVLSQLALTPMNAIIPTALIAGSDLDEAVRAAFRRFVEKWSDAGTGTRRPSVMRKGGPGRPSAVASGLARRRIGR